MDEALEFRIAAETGCLRAWLITLTPRDAALRATHQVRSGGTLTIHLRPIEIVEFDARRATVRLAADLVIEHDICGVARPREIPWPLRQLREALSLDPIEMVRYSGGLKAPCASVRPARRFRVA